MSEPITWYRVAPEKNQVSVSLISTLPTKQLCGFYVSKNNNIYNNTNSEDTPEHAEES